MYLLLISGDVYCYLMVTFIDDHYILFPITSFRFNRLDSTHVLFRCYRYLY